MEGFVYIFSNNAMPGLLRVGITSRNPKEVARFLSGAGISSPFVLEYCVKSDAYEEIGRESGKLLLGCYAGNELFGCDPQTCIRAIKKAAHDHLPYKEWYRDKRLKDMIDSSWNMRGERQEGYVYVLSDGAASGSLKVGFSSRDPGDVARSLSGPGASSPFVVEYCVKSAAYEAIGKRSGALLSGWYVGDGLFMCDLTMCIRKIKLAAHEHLPYKEWYRDRLMRDRFSEAGSDRAEGPMRFAGEARVDREPDDDPRTAAEGRDTPENDAAQEQNREAPEERRGYVYVLSNPAMPGLLKIGCTFHDPQKRAAELETTGVPEPFVVEYWIRAFGYQAIEQKAHRQLKDRNSRKEFFKCDLEECIGALRHVAHGISPYEEWHRDKQLQARIDGREIEYWKLRCAEAEEELGKKRAEVECLRREAEGRSARVHGARR